MMPKTRSCKLMVLCAVLLACALAGTARDATAFNPTCTEKGKAREFALIIPDASHPDADKPIRLTVPVPYLPIPPENYRERTVSLILRASWPTLKPACLDVENFTVEPGQDPAAIMLGHFNRFVTLQIAGSTSLSLELTRDAQLELNPYDYGLSDDGGLRIYASKPKEEADMQPMEAPRPFGGMPNFEFGQVLVPVEPDETPLVWMLCVQLPLSSAPHQCQARLKINDRVQVEMTFSHNLLADWKQAMDAAATLVTRFIDDSNSQPL